MQLKRVSAPFGEVNVTPAKGGRQAVRATVPIGVRKEGAQTGLALDASGSMESNYADLTGRGNVITPVARGLCAYLASEVDQDGGTTAIYWAMGRGGADVQVIGDLTAEQARGHSFTKPHPLGGDTALLPAVKYFVERFADAPWGLYVFLTDGAFNDLAAVKAYTRGLAQSIKAGKRNPLKLVLVGVGSGVNEGQMAELDDLSTGTDLPDLWDHKVAADMRSVNDVAAEVIDANARVAKTGRVLSPDGAVLKDYSDTGVPAAVEFEAPAGLAYFTLELDGRKFHQSLSDSPTVRLPVSDLLPGEQPVPGVAPGTTFAKELSPPDGPVGKILDAKAPDTADADFDVTEHVKGGGDVADFDVTDKSKGTDVDLGKR